MRSDTCSYCVLLPLPLPYLVAWYPFPFPKSRAVPDWRHGVSQYSVAQLFDWQPEDVPVIDDKIELLYNFCDPIYSTRIKITCLSNLANEIKKEYIF